MLIYMCNHPLTKNVPQDNCIESEATRCGKSQNKVSACDAGYIFIHESTVFSMDPAYDKENKGMAADESDIAGEKSFPPRIDNPRRNLHRNARYDDADYLHHLHQYDRKQPTPDTLFL